MERIAFRTQSGSAYVVDFGTDGIEVIRVSDHPVGGQVPDSNSFACRFASVEFAATPDGIRVQFRSGDDPRRDFYTSPVQDLFPLPAS